MLNGYNSKGCYDEIITANGEARIESHDLLQFFSEASHIELLSRARAAELAIREMGVSFSVYSDDSDKVDVDRNWQLDIIPRTIGAKIWREGDIDSRNGFKTHVDMYNLPISEIDPLDDSLLPQKQ